MENVAKFPISKTTPPETAEDQRVRDFVAAIETFLSPLSIAQRESVVRILAGAIRPDTSSKAGDVLGVLLRILPNRNEWTVGELKKVVSERGVKATDKQIFNAVGHLTRKGRIKRVSYGRYVVEGVQIETADDFGVELSRVETMDPN